MAADHYLNKVFVCIPPVKTTTPHQPFPAPLQSHLLAAASSATGGRELHERRPRVARTAAASRLFFLADG